MAIKKSQLYSSIWQACDELRGGMDASQYKDYVLVFLFIRYVSDKYAGKPNQDVEVPSGGSFADLVALKGKTDIGEGINKVLSKLAEANELQGVIDVVDFNDEEKLGKGKEMQDRLTQLISIFENPDLNFSTNRAEGDDLLGDAYEYLMKNFAVESGKSKGQFYTPAEVSRIVAKVIGARNATGPMQTVYDPTCGSGSLLLKVSSETPHGISIYGQEKENVTAGLAILNMWLHSQPTAVIKKGVSTLSNPLFLDNGGLKTFDYVVANPPFSYKAWRTGFSTEFQPEHDQYDRFDGYGIPPKKNGDYAFFLHILKSLKSTGTGAVILPHGVLFRGNVEGEIRKNIIERKYIKGIIGLPANLFYGTGIPACIIILDKKDAQDRKGIFMIDASRGFVKDGNKNRLREQDIRKIVDVWDAQAEIEKYSHFASYEEIEKKNEYNLNLPRYIDTSETEDLQDIEAHLKGGIPAYDIELLDNYWQVLPKLKSILFKNSKRAGYFDTVISSDEIRSTIINHDEFLDYKKSIKTIFNKWADSNSQYLKDLNKSVHPKAVIKTLADNLIEVYKDVKLIDKFDIYQILLTYWEEVMQDDVYIITSDEWKAGNEIIQLQKVTKKDGKEVKKDIAGLYGIEGRLIPLKLFISIYLQQEQVSLESLQTKLEELGAKMEELKEEHGGDEGLLTEVINEKGNISKGDLNKRIKETKGDVDLKDEFDILQTYAGLLDDEADTKKQIKDVENDIEKKVIQKYPTLSLDEIKTVVIDKKWFASLEASLMNEVNRLTQALAGRVKELSDRYQETLPEITRSVEELSKKVNEHIEKMGYKI